MSQIKPRDVSPLISIFRNILLGRTHRTALRFQKDLAPRTAAPPDLPEGPAHKISDNYYYVRDARREVKPPTLLADPKTLKSIAAGKEGGVAVAKKSRTPGDVYLWD